MFLVLDLELRGACFAFTSSTGTNFQQSLPDSNIILFILEMLEAPIPLKISGR